MDLIKNARTVSGSCCYGWSCSETLHYDDVAGGGGANVSIDYPPCVCCFAQLVRRQLESAEKAGKPGMTVRPPLLCFAKLWCFVVGDASCC